MCLFQLAPVHSWVVVMDSVVTIVEEQKVEPEASEVSRVIVLRPSIGMNVLDKVEKHDRCARTNRGQDQRKEPNIQSKTGLR